MVTKEFLNAFNKLNTAQKKAVDTIEGAVMVIAGPGTGKTQILTVRIANILLKTQINPENILALTFTDSGVYAMRKRLVAIIGTPGYRVQINTFHGFCNELIKNSPEDFPRFISSNNVEEIEQIQIVEEIIDKESFTLLKPFGNPFFYVKPALQAIGELKKEGITPEKFLQAVRKDEEDFKTIDDLYHEKGSYKGLMKSHYEKRLKNITKNIELSTIYIAYQKALHHKKLYDFNDMLLEVINALEQNPQLLLRLQEQYQYLLVDEHQDTNAAQNKIIELLCSFYPNPNLFVVGDEKQSIYRFQGASLENFLYFKKLYPEALLINLTDNYRSSQTILNASGELITNNLLASRFMPQNSHLIAHANHPEEKITIINASDYYSEYYLIANAIKIDIEKGIEPKEIAIIAKENKDLLPLVDIFEKLSIPFVLESNKNILEDNDIQKLILLFNALHKFGEDKELIKAMHLACLEIHPLDIIKLLNISYKRKISVWEILSTGEYKEDKTFKTSDKIEQFYTNLINWQLFNSNEQFDFLFKHILHDSGFMKSLITKKNSFKNLDKITNFYQDIKQQINKNPDFSLDTFIQYLDLLKKHAVSIKNNTKTVHINAVRCMTAHKSKGLEFDITYIINVYDGHWGNSRKKSALFSLPWNFLLERITTLTDEEKNEDQRRLFYVALTRARKEVRISYSTHSMDGKEQVPSQFIEEIQIKHKILADIKNFEENFLANKEIILSPLPIITRQDIENEYKANREMFTEMFMRKGFSATHLNNYLECPWKYFFRNLLSLPDTLTKPLMFGSAIHKALSLYLIHNNNTPSSVTFLLNAYHVALQQQPLTKDEQKELTIKGDHVLTNYYNAKMIHWPNTLISELNIKGILFSEKVKLTGIIDMIEPIKHSHDVTVYDFKTGKPKTRRTIEGTTKNGDGDYKRQLLFYKILLDEYKLKKMNMTTGIIEFVEPNEKGVYKQEVFSIIDSDIKTLRQLIEEITSEILALGFWNKGCKKNECEYCLLRSYIGS